MTVLTEPGPCVVQMSAYGPDREILLSVLAKRTYRIEPSGSCTVAPEQLPLRVEPVLDPERRNLLICDIETYPFKLLTDVVVRGHAYPGESPREARAEVRVGGVTMLLQVFGDRRASRGASGRISFSDPEPFEKIPLEYDRAYGGWDEVTEARRGHPLAPLAPYLQKNTELSAYSPYVYPRNRHGRGYIVEATPEGFDRLRLPNLEDPLDRLTPERLVVGKFLEWHKMPLPACTTWTPPSYFGRGVFLGMFPFWQKLPDVLPEFNRGQLPREVSEISILAGHPLVLRFTNGAPLGLQVPYLHAGDKVVLVGLHEHAARLEIVIPDDFPKISADGRNGKLAPTEPVIHHVEIEPDAGRMAIVWRGAAPALRPYLPDELRKMPLAVEWRTG